VVLRVYLSLYESILSNFARGGVLGNLGSPGKLIVLWGSADMNAVEILNLKGLHLDISRYVVLQTYKHCGVDALKSGDHWLFSMEEFYPLKDCYETLKVAIEKGYLDVIKLCYQYNSIDWKSCYWTQMECAVWHGHLEIVKWLHENTDVKCTRWAMDWAAQRGHLDILIWLHENRSEGCTVKAMDCASEEGHLDVVKWLHEHRSEGCTSYAMDSAAHRGHLEVVKWLHEHTKKGCSHWAMVYATWKGHIDVVKWLHENKPGESCNYGTKYMCDAKADLEVLKWHCDNCENFTKKYEEEDYEEDEEEEEEDEDEDEEEEENN
jgi:hypothetical protein